MVNDPLGDMLTRIRNALMRNKRTVSTPASALRRRVLEVLKTEGYIRDYAEVEHSSGQKELEIELKYYEGDSVIQHIKRISKPGRRVYSGVKDIALVQNGLGIAILSTPQGVMSDTSAREANVGGEILCHVS
ncbi:MULTISPECIES: 30S ribosomal protein S8 [Maricaulis]|uniref:Small ribosomal subunit protein uS8 n=1 Tax=Maricaulis salignorans TaxID=144026 RepID=A0A1G9TBJ5_9PROT|nr:30S ribosomal protein S8 [Maricaulis salignorans]SDM45089.1 small subunit ribosomal protein S8 [Maricaulis salignorans]